MSVLSEKVRVALFDVLNVPDVTNLATGGVHHLIAPKGTPRPYIVFSRQAPGVLTYAFQNTRIAENDLWLIKAISDEDSSSTKEPQQLNEEILAMAESKIGNTLTLTGGSVTWNVERELDIPEFVEMMNDRELYNNGFLLRVWTA